MGHNSVLGLYCRHIDLILRFKRQNTFTQPVPSGAAKKNPGKTGRRQHKREVFHPGQAYKTGPFLSCDPASKTRSGRRWLWGWAGRPDEMQGTAEQRAHHTVELWCRSRLRATCQARAASIGAAVWRRRGALLRCGGGHEQGRQAPAMELRQGGQVKCRARQSRAHTTQ